MPSPPTLLWQDLVIKDLHLLLFTDDVFFEAQSAVVEIHVANQWRRTKPKVCVEKSAFATHRPQTEESCSGSLFSTTWNEDAFKFNGVPLDSLLMLDVQSSHDRRKSFGKCTLDLSQLVASLQISMQVELFTVNADSSWTVVRNSCFSLVIVSGAQIETPIHSLHLQEDKGGVVSLTVLDVGPVASNAEGFTVEVSLNGNVQETQVKSKKSDDVVSGRYHAEFKETFAFSNVKAHHIVKACLREHPSRSIIGNAKLSLHNLPNFTPAFSEVLIVPPAENVEEEGIVPGDDSCISFSISVDAAIPKFPNGFPFPVPCLIGFVDIKILSAKDLCSVSGKHVPRSYVKFHLTSSPESQPCSTVTTNPTITPQWNEEWLGFPVYRRPSAEMRFEAFEYLENSNIHPSLGKVSLKLLQLQIGVANRIQCPLLILNENAEWSTPLDRATSLTLEIFLHGFDDELLSLPNCTYWHESEEESVNIVEAEQQQFDKNPNKVKKNELSDNNFEDMHTFKLLKLHHPDILEAVLPSSSDKVERHMFDNGDVYTGEWKGNVMHGRGTYLHRLSGNVYEGNYENGMKNGYGVFTNCSSRIVYKGFWKDGLRSGQGMLIFPAGDVYHGQFTNNEFSDRGVFIHSSGDRYEGNWLNGVENGQGLISYSDGSSYDGEWKNGKKHGIGTLISQFAVYVGLWENGLPHGRGVVNYSDGSKFEGNFVLGMANGHGKFTYRDGAHYDGDWKNNTRSGRSLYCYANGSQCVGLWDANKMNGLGLYTDINGGVHSVSYVDGKCVATSVVPSTVDNTNLQPLLHLQQLLQYNQELKQHQQHQQHPHARSFSPASMMHSFPSLPNDPYGVWQALN